MQMKLLLFKWSRDYQVYTSLLNLAGLFILSFVIPLLMVMNQGLLCGAEWTEFKKSKKHFTLFDFTLGLLFLIFTFLFSCRYKPSSSGCGPQARTEGARRGHSSLAQSCCPESHNHSGHMDSKYSLAYSDFSWVFSLQEHILWFFDCAKLSHSQDSWH